MNNDYKIKNIPYEYQHAPVPGGGYVTGFCFHPKMKDILYARTDIGGVYRYDFHSRTWNSLMDHVTAIDKWESYPLSIALDNHHPEWLYIAAGDYKKNYLCRSKDRGNHFEYFMLPAGVHGNAPSRGTGERLIVDPQASSILYFGSQTEGLFVSEDFGESFQPLDVKPYNQKVEKDIAFVWIDPRSFQNGRCQTLVVSTSGKANSPGDNVRGNSLYISRDAGKTFEPLPGQPVADMDGNYPGFVGQRAVFSGSYLYITMTYVKNARFGWRSYSCDSGGEQQGCVLRYELSDTGEIIDFGMITPDTSIIGGSGDCICKLAGFGGITVDSNRPGRLLCSTQCSKTGDAVFYSKDYGKSWFPVLYGLTIGKMVFQEVSYMKPEYNNNRNIIHWLTDIKIDPFNSNRAVFNTGIGIFITENLTEAEKKGQIIWGPSCKGLEETVHLNVYSPPEGDVQLIDLVGDLGGFAFTNLTRPAVNSFSDENNHRYITCLNADFPDSNPKLVAVTARGNWSGKTIGGIIWSEDQCKSWTRLPDPVNLSERVDQIIEGIRRPNTNSGWTAISADAKTLVWCLGEGSKLPMDAVVYTEDKGRTWAKSKVFDKEHKELKKPELTFKVLSDRVDSDVFYGFSDSSDMYISTDRARSFYQIKVPEDFPKLELGGIDGKMPAELRAESGKPGVVWIATGEGGLWRIIFSKEQNHAVFQRISRIGDIIFRQGMGRPAPHSRVKTLYVNGVIDQVYGFYRSIDEGRTWQRINSDKQMYGDIRSITGDPRIFGRIYIATGSRGVLWGMPRRDAT